MVMAGDCHNRGVEWSGKGVVNPYLEEGGLAHLEDFPRFAAYLNEHADALRRRHTAQRQPNRWYKTIDRIYPSLTTRPKLLIPDIKGDATIALDEGNYYPHHNLYVVTSDVWDLRVLKTVLRSSVALMFVAAYCVRMAGGFLRFQAQYLRRIRVPEWSSLSNSQRRTLAAAADEPEQEAIDALVLPLYGLTSSVTDRIQEYAAEARVTGSI